jgi:hypothetical protein
MSDRLAIVGELTVTGRPHTLLCKCIVRVARLPLRDNDVEKLAAGVDEPGPHR